MRYSILIIVIFISPCSSGSNYELNLSTSPKSDSHTAFDLENVPEGTGDSGYGNSGCGGTWTGVKLPVLPTKRSGPPASLQDPPNKGEYLRFKWTKEFNGQCDHFY